MSTLFWVLQSALIVCPLCWYQLSQKFEMHGENFSYVWSDASENILILKPSSSSHSKPPTGHLKCFVLNTLCSKTKHLRCLVRDLVQGFKWLEELGLRSNETALKLWTLFYWACPIFVGRWWYCSKQSVCKWQRLYKKLDI